jgi:Domain of unknown function (DUF4372)
VRHRNSVFHDVLKLVPWASFDNLGDEHGADAASRRFTSRQHLTTLLFAQLSDAASLREIEAAMPSHQGRLYHSGALAPKRSTFADANRSRDFLVFSGLFEAMLAGASRGFRRKMADAVRLIDSTGLRLAGAGAEWARFSTSVFGVKRACRLRSRPRAPDLPRCDRRERQRHHGRQGDAGRGGRNLCVRPRLLRLRLL